MINRIRTIRKDKGMTLAELAEACVPPTTAQTVGRLETGMRNLSLKWMERIGAALGVDPEMLVRGEDREHPQIVAALQATGPEALAQPARRTACPPRSAVKARGWCCKSIIPMANIARATSCGYANSRPEDTARAINRDVLVPRKAGRFAFGRLIDRRGNLVGILPPGHGEKQQVIDNPPWIAVAEMLVRRL